MYGYKAEDMSPKEENLKVRLIPIWEGLYYADEANPSNCLEIQHRIRYTEIRLLVEVVSKEERKKVFGEG